MRTLVTGGLGVNGAWLTRQLLTEGHHVSVLENRIDTSLIEDVATDLEIMDADICDGDRVHELVRQTRPDVVIHLAAVVDCERNPYAAIAVNVGGTANVCTAAAAARVPRLVYTSSKAVYAPGVGVHGHPRYELVDETFDRDPRSLYGVTKLAGEHVVNWFRRQHAMDAASLRFATVFGPGRVQRHRSISAYSAMIEHPALGQPFELERGASERDDLIYVLDVADAIVQVATSDAPLAHAAYNVTAGIMPTIEEFADVIRAVIVDAEIEIGDGLDPLGYGHEAPYYLGLDGSRFGREFGWRPSFDLRRAVEHHRDQLVAGRRDRQPDAGPTPSEPLWRAPGDHR